MYEVCPSPFQPSRTAGRSQRVSATAQAYGVAGSFRSPTTSTGVAIWRPVRAVEDGPASTGDAGTVQYAQGSDPHSSDGPNIGDAFAAVAAAACHAGSDRGQRESTQLTAVPTSARLL